MRLCVIGGGMCGFAAAIAAARAGASVTVLEAGARPLRKLRASGGGRGNLLNTGSPRYYGDAAFARHIVGPDGAKRAMAFWQSCGVMLACEGELVYPASFQAGDAADALEMCALEAGVQVRPDTRALSLLQAGGAWQITSRISRYDIQKTPKREKRVLSRTEDVRFAADAVLVCCGGAAASQLGGCADGPALLRQLGCDIAPMAPALRPLPLLPFAGQKACAGKRLRCGVRVLAPSGDVRCFTRGEVLFTQEGLSGIAAMQCARHLRPGDTLALDASALLCETEKGGMQPETAVLAALQARAALLPGRTFAALGTGLMDAALWRALGLSAGLVPETAVCPQGLAALASRLCCWALPLAPMPEGALDAAQVTAGGARCAAFSPGTLEHQALSGLYAGGETLDVDGDCGGFNLMFATLCGLTVARAVTEK